MPDFARAKKLCQDYPQITQIYFLRNLWMALFMRKVLRGVGGFERRVRVRVRRR